MIGLLFVFYNKKHSMKKVFNATRNICLILVLGYLLFQFTTIYHPELIEDYVTHFRVSEEETALGIMSIDPIVQEEKQKTPLARKVILKNGMQKIYFKPSDLIRIESKEGTSILIFNDGKEIQSRMSIKNIWAQFIAVQQEEEFFQTSEHIINLEYVVVMASINRSPHLSNYYRPELVFTNQDTITLPKRCKGQLEEKLAQIASAPISN